VEARRGSSKRIMSDNSQGPAIRRRHSLISSLSTKEPLPLVLQAQGRAQLPKPDVADPHDVTSKCIQRTHTISLPADNRLAALAHSELGAGLL